MPPKKNENNSCRERTVVGDVVIKLLTENDLPAMHPAAIGVHGFFFFGGDDMVGCCRRGLHRSLMVRLRLRLRLRGL